MSERKTARDALPRDMQLRALGSASGHNDHDTGLILDTLHACGFRIAAGYHATPAVPARLVMSWPCRNCGTTIGPEFDGTASAWCEKCKLVCDPPYNQGATPTPPAPAVRDDGARVAVPLLVFQRADTARTAYLRDVDANDQIGALDAALAAALAAADAVAGAGRDGDALDARVTALEEAAGCCDHCEGYWKNEDMRTAARSIGAWLRALKVCPPRIAAGLAPPAGEVGSG